MLVSAKSNLITPLPKQPGEDPTAEAAAGLQSVLAQALQNNLQAQTTPATKQVQESATGQATQQVSQATRISDNVDEAFAKTRVNLQAVEGKATTEFKDYMSKSPEQRLRDSILKEMGLTQEEVDQMPPEKQKAIGEEIAQRIQDKAEIAKAEKAQQSGDKSGAQVVDKFLASL